MMMCKENKYEIFQYLNKKTECILGSIYNISTFNNPKFCTDDNNVQSVTLISCISSSYCESIPAYDACLSAEASATALMSISGNNNMPVH
jgi:hypothetical protein